MFRINICRSILSKIKFNTFKFSINNKCYTNKLIKYSTNNQMNNQINNQTKNQINNQTKNNQTNNQINNQINNQPNNQMNNQMNNQINNQTKNNQMNNQINNQTKNNTSDNKFLRYTGYACFAILVVLGLAFFEILGAVFYGIWIICILAAIASAL